MDAGSGEGHLRWVPGVSNLKTCAAPGRSVNFSDTLRCHQTWQWAMAIPPEKIWSCQLNIIYKSIHDEFSIAMFDFQMLTSYCVMPREWHSMANVGNAATQMMSHKELDIWKQMARKADFQLVPPFVAEIEVKHLPNWTEVRNVFGPR